VSKPKSCLKNKIRRDTIQPRERQQSHLSWVACLLTLILGGIALAVQEIAPIPTHFSVAWSVCLSVVCHVRALCLNRSTDLDAIWQVHLWGPMTHCVRWGSLAPKGNGDLGVERRSQNV